MKDNKEFYKEGVDSEVVNLQIEAFDELVDDIMLEAFKHMTAGEKLDQEKYRRSSAGKKALAKHAKKVARAGYKVDKKRSKLMQKVADFRKDESLDEEALLEFDVNDEALCEAIFEILEAEDVAFFDSLVEEVCAFLEACKDEDCDCEDDDEIDPETGDETDDEDLDEGFKHMTAAAKNKAKKYRNSAAGKKALKKYAKNLERRHGKVDKTRSKLMKKVAAFSFEAEDLAFAEEMGLTEAELASLDKFVGTILANAAEILEGEDEIEIEEAEYQIEIPSSQEEIDEALENIEGVEVVAEEDGVFTLEGSEDALSEVLEALGFDEDFEDFLTEESLNEFQIHHMTAAERLASKMRRKQPQFKKWLKKYLKKRSMGSYRVNKALSKKMKRVAALRREAIEESLDAQFSATPLFESLNEGESNELKGIVFNAVSSILDQSYEKIAEDVTKEYEAYMNEEAMPEMVRVFEEYSAEIVKNLNENVEEYLNYVAESILDEFENKNLVVKSQKSEALEAFSEDLLALIKDKLNIIPEQEDVLVKNQETIKKLSDEIQEAKVEALRMKDKLEESKRENYVLRNLPNELSDLQKENIQNYVADVLSEAEDFNEFKTYFDEAVKKALSTNEAKEEKKEPIVEAKKEEKKNFSSLFESLERMGRI